MNTSSCLSPVMEMSELYSIQSPKSQSSSVISHAPTPIKSNNKQSVSAFSSLADLKARQRILAQKFNCSVGASECVYEVVPGAHKRVHSCEPSEADYKLLGLYTPNIHDVDESDDSSSDTRDPNELFPNRQKLTYDQRSEPCCLGMEENEFLEDDSNFSDPLEFVNSYSHDYDEISELRENSSGRYPMSSSSSRKKRKPNLKKIRRRGRTMVSNFWRRVRPVFSKAKKMFSKKEVVEFTRAKGTLL